MYDTYAMYAIARRALPAGPLTVPSHGRAVLESSLD